MTPAEIARLVGVSSSTVNRWLSGVPYRTRRTGGRPARVYDLETVARHLASGKMDNSEAVALIRAAQ